MRYFARLIILSCVTFAAAVAGADDKNTPAACPNPSTPGANLKTPTVDPVDIGSDQVTGTAYELPKGAQVIVCIDKKDAYTVQPGDNGKFSITTKTALTSDQKITAQSTVPGVGGAAASFGSSSDAISVGKAPASFDFGRVRVNLSAGAILSQDQGQFSKASTYLDFNTDSTWYMKGQEVNPDQTQKKSKKTAASKAKDQTQQPPDQDQKKSKYPGKGFQVNSLFDARLTALPTASCPTTATTGGTASNTCTPSSIPSITTPKAALIVAGAYLPIYLARTSWIFDDHRHALYFAPLAKGGFQTLVQSVQGSTGTPSGTSTQVNAIQGETFFHFFEFGSRFGLFRFHDEHAGTAPDQILYLDIAGGKYQNFPTLNASLPTNQQITGYPWRMSMEGRFNIPKIPVFIGFNSNTQPGGRRTVDAPGDLRFLFGTSFDVGCLLQKLNVNNNGIAGCDTKSSSSTTTKSGGGNQ